MRSLKEVIEIDFGLDLTGWDLTVGTVADTSTDPQNEEKQEEKPLHTFFPRDREIIRFPASSLAEWLDPPRNRNRSARNPAGNYAPQARGGSTSIVRMANSAGSANMGKGANLINWVLSL